MRKSKSSVGSLRLEMFVFTNFSKSKPKRGSWTGQECQVKFANSAAHDTHVPRPSNCDLVSYRGLPLPSFWLPKLAPNRVSRRSIRYSEFSSSSDQTKWKMILAAAKMVRDWLRVRRRRGPIVSADRCHFNFGGLMVAGRAICRSLLSLLRLPSKSVMETLLPFQYPRNTAL